MIKLPNPGGPLFPRVLLLMGLTAPLLHGQATIPQTEQDDSIPTANATGFTAGSSGIKVAFGNNGDGPFGEFGGDGTGDVDFYKISAAAGQVIYVNINNAGIDPDFDPFVGLYDSAGTVVAENDDEGDTTRGYDRTSRFTFTVPATGDYYVCVSNWIGDVNLPADPMTPGTAPGLAAGNPGSYQLFIGLDVAVPIPQFVGGSTGYPVPTFLPAKVLGTPRLDGQVTIRNTSTGAAPAANYVINSYTVTGPQASRFTITGLNTPVTVAPGAEVNFTVAFDGVGFAGLAQATLELNTNDPFAQNFKLDTFASPVVGGGQFVVKQIVSTSGNIGSIEAADLLLDGTNAGTAFDSQTRAINYGNGADGHFPTDVKFPDGAADPNQFALRVTGNFFIREAGDYTFLGYSDDGQRLKIDGEELYVFNDANVDHFATVTLTAGVHALEYTMYEGAGGNSAELLISRQKGTFESYLASTWELLEAYSQDADEDGMPDDYEIANGTNKDVSDANVDLDSDGLTNIQEYALGTKPNVADTDDDGLLDGVETKTGLYASASSTGTDPLVKDTDGDGLLDGVEIPTLPHTGPTQPGTDPNKKDTDGDGYADLSEASLGTDPTSAASAPVFTFKTALSDDFEATGFHSVYEFKNLNNSAAFAPGIYETADAVPTKVARLNQEGINSTHNALAFDYVDTPSTTAAKLEFDFRLTSEGSTNPADGFGIGFFRKSVYGTAGVSPLITDGKAWENPTGAGGYGDALFFGFTIYGTDVIRVTGPAAPTVALSSVATTFPLVTGKFNRAIITVITNGPASSMVKLEIIEDVAGAATRRVIADNVLVPGFVLANEDYRIIAGGRTGGANETAELDNVVYSVAAGTAPTLVLSNNSTSLLASVYDTPASAVSAASVTATVNGTTIPVTATKTGDLTTISYTASTGSFFPAGTNTVVFNYTAGGTPVTETRTFTVAPYYGFPASLGVPVSQAGTPGVALTVKQVAPRHPEELELPNILAVREGVFSALNLGYDGTPYAAGGNTAEADAVGVQPVINFEQDGTSIGNIPNDVLFPGIPGTTGSTDNFQTQSLTWLEFPGPGLYRLGVTGDDGFRLSATHAPVPTLSVVSPAAGARILAFWPSVTGSPLGGIAGPNPVPPLVKKVVAAVPADGTSALTNAAEIAGNIALIDRGTNAFAAKILFAQQAGAAAVIIVNENNPDRLPAGMGGDGTGITIPAGMISKGDGDILKALIASTPAGVMLSYGEDNSTTILKDDRGRGAGDGDIIGTVAVPAAGLYPVRLFHFEGGGGANLEFYSVTPDGVKHLINDEADEASLKAYATIVGGGTGATLSLTRTGNSVTITYTGTLESSADLVTWTNVTGATSPYTFNLPSTGKLFFRAKE